MTRGTLSRISLTAAVFLLCVNSARSREIRRLTLSQAFHLAVEQNRTLKIARFQVKENDQRKAGARSAYFLSITNQSNALHISELQNIVNPLGPAAGASIPPQSISVSQGKQTLQLPVSATATHCALLWTREKRAICNRHSTCSIWNDHQRASQQTPKA